MEKFDRANVPRGTISDCIADLTLEKYVLGEQIEYLESLTEAYKRSEAKANDKLCETENELANVKEQLDAANKKIESLKRSNDTLSTTVSVLTDDNRRLKQANELLSATPGNIRVVNIVTEFRPGEPVRTKVYWGDGKATTVTLAVGDIAAPYTAFCAALAKKVFGSTPKVRKLVENKRTIVCFDEAKEGDIDAGH